MLEVLWMAVLEVLWSIKAWRRINWQPARHFIPGGVVRRIEHRLQPPHDVVDVAGMCDQTQTPELIRVVLMAETGIEEAVQQVSHI